MKTKLLTCTTWPICFLSFTKSKNHIHLDSLTITTSPITNIANVATTFPPSADAKLILTWAPWNLNKMIGVAGASISKKEQQWTWPWMLWKLFKDPWILGPRGWFKIPSLKRVTSSSAAFHQYTTGKCFVETKLISCNTYTIYELMLTVFLLRSLVLYHFSWTEFGEIDMKGWSLEWRWPLPYKYSTRNRLYQAGERTNQQYIHFWGSWTSAKYKEKHDLSKHHISKWVQERWSPFRISWTRHPGWCTTRLQPLVPTGSARCLEWTSLRLSTVEWI